MAKHVKPTQEELAEIEKKAVEDVEKLKDAPIEETEPTNVSETELEADLEASDEVDETETDDAEPSEEEKEILKKEIEDKKKKLSASARENQKIYAKNRVINNAIAEAEELPEPTDEEMAKEFAEWEVMSDTEKTFARETVITRRWRAKIKEASQQANKIEKWNDSVEEYAEDPKTLVDHPELEGKVEAFKKFAMQESNNSVPMNILVSAFLHESSSGRVPNKGKMFDTGSGGSNTKPANKDGKISLEDARKIRETNYSKYKELLLAGKIESGL